MRGKGVGSCFITFLVGVCKKHKKRSFLLSERKLIKFVPIGLSGA